MPHQCTTCGHTFEDGSKEMLGGCPDCGGNTFQFHPPGSDLPTEPPADTEPPDREDPTGASAVGRAATRVRDFVSGADDAPASTDLRDGGDDGVDVVETGGPDGTDRTAETRESDGTSVAGGSGTTTETSTTDGPTGTNDGPTETNATGPSAGAGSRTDRSSRRRSRDFSREPDPNAPWPTEDDDPPGSGGDTDRQSSSTTGGDDIIDADARETERAIGDAEDPGGRSTDTAPSGRDPETPSVSDGDHAAPNDSPDTRVDPDTGSPSGADHSLDAGADPAPGSDESGLAAAENAPADEGQVVSEPSDDQPDLADLREQLNEQFESIKILEPGQYELNLMELYDREEYIIALQENGRYVIQVPENWMGDRPGDE